MPAVVAMQFPISDKAAIAFSETFYQRIAKGDPVDVAMAEGRKKLWHLEEWATPVLFLRSKDGVLFEPATACASRLPRQRRTRRTASAPGHRRDARRSVGRGRRSTRPRIPRHAVRSARPRTQAAREEARAELGVRVVDSVPREDPGAHAAAVQRLVRSADLSVHLLGDNPGAALDDDERDSLRTYPLQELTIGIEAAPSQLVLIPDTVDIERLEDRAVRRRASRS